MVEIISRLNECGPRSVDEIRHYARVASSPPTNIRVQRPSRKRVHPGDVFAVQLPNEKFLFGRVVSMQAQWTLAAGADPAILIYICRGLSAMMDLPDRAAV